MFDISLFELLAFLRQVSGAVFGAAALHGIVFMRRREGELARLLDHLMIGGAIAFIMIWGTAFAVHTSEVFAHIGVAIQPESQEYGRGFELQAPLVGILALLLVAYRWGNRGNGWRTAFFAVSSLLLIVYAAVENGFSMFSVRQFFYAFHGWHSILTLGTVMCLDSLFFATRNNRALFAKLSHSFARFTAIIFVGLGMDIFSTWFILDDALVLDSRFFWMQTIIAILLTNGILLSGLATRKALPYIRAQQEIPIHLRTLLGFMGSVSIISWLSITFLDGTPNISLSYFQMATGYAVLIGCAFVVHLIVDNLTINHE